MLSGSLDEVSRNSIWEEHCKKETRTLRLNDHFSISDPRKMTILPDKPNYVIPTPNPDPSTVMSAKKELQELCDIKDAEKLPAEKYCLPITGNQDYGFIHKPMVKQNPMFVYPKTTCDVTDYADTYASMAGTSPFARKEGEG
ncbi:hypothetical protein BSKO_11295 [Bryopsis sp. KO-2023]|nr:hypothetical protein BSKO_11295 [Bryopsis sp. KO-2023]